MDLEKIFYDLESNQNLECEEAKKKLVELFTQNKDQWFVHSLMEYYLKTGSARIIEVLVKAQPPHDGYIFDRLADWLKSSSHRVHALNLFCFVVRRHPTWLFKVEKHRLIKDMLHWLKQLEIEKEIVPLMSALLAIITLLPIIPNLVPNFLNDLFAVFAHLASWNSSQHPCRLTEDKLVHLQLGLQMLFHRLYGMFPCNFMAFLTDFIRKEKGAIFQHTIKPLLETVRLHPMLVTATVDSEVNSDRWKEIQPHDVVVECMRLSLPMKFQDLNATATSNTLANTLSSTTTTTSSFHQLTATTTTSAMSRHYPQQRLNTGGNNNFGIWSPYHEIINATTHTPLTPTPAPYMMPTVINQGSLGVTGCSPPEAAVEATPETTPLKDNRELKRTSIGGSSGVANPLAVRAIFAPSQPSSPHRAVRETQNQLSHMPQQHFNFPDATPLASGSCGTTTTTFVEQEVNARLITRVTTTCDRKIQQVLHDRNQSQSPFQTIEAQTAKMGFQTPTDYCRTPDADVVALSGVRFYQQSNSTTPLSALTATPTPGSTPLPVQTATEIPITKVCDECNETDQTLCTEGGLQMPTSRSMQLLAKGIKRRNRMTSYCYNEKSCEKVGVNGGGNGCSSDFNNTFYKVRRTKSLSALNKASSKTSQSSGDNSDTNEEDYSAATAAKINLVRPLQKCPKMMAIASVMKNTSQTKSIQFVDKAMQTLDAVPVQNHENSLLQMLIESKEFRLAYETSRQTPNEILEQFIARGLRNTSSMDRFDQEQFQLLCLQLQYERYRREIHAERNRRLMGRSRDKRSLEMERDRLKEQLKDFEMKNKELSFQLDKTKKTTNDREREYQDELSALKAKYQNELEQNRYLRQANENLQTKLTEELGKRKDINYELEALRGQVFSLTTELQHAQHQADVGLNCRQELARLESDFIVMGEVQIKCRDKFAEIDNCRARDEELIVLQDAYNIEIKNLKHYLDDRTSQLDSARHKIQELQAQLVNNEKVITEQKRLLRAVKDEYEEKVKSLNKKYEVQKIIIMQMEEKFMMSLHRPQSTVPVQASCSPDTDKTDVASSVERNSPLSTSLASSESLSTSLRSSELRNLQQLVETPVTEVTSSSVISSSSAINVLTGAGGGINIIDGQRLPPQTLDLASSANTATNVFNLLTEQRDISSPEAGGSSRNLSLATTTTHMHTHLNLQQQQQQQQHPSYSKQYLQTKPSTSSSAATMEQQSQQNR